MWCWCWLQFSPLLLRRWNCWVDFFFGFNNRYMIRQRLLRTSLTRGIPWQHDFDFDSQYTLSEVEVSNSHVDVLLNRISTVDHEAICEFHGFSSLSSQLTRNNNFTDGFMIHSGYPIQEYIDV